MLNYSYLQYSVSSNDCIKQLLYDNDDDDDDDDGDDDDDKTWP